MAKTCSIEKNNRRKMLVERYRARRQPLIAIIKDPAASMEKKLAAQEKLAKIPRNASPVRVRNRCELTGRPRAFIGMFKLCRMKFRELALLGQLPGVKKTSW